MYYTTTITFITRFTKIDVTTFKANYELSLVGKDCLICYDYKYLRQNIRLCVQLHTS